MVKTYNLFHSIALLKAHKKIYKKPLYQIAFKSVQYEKEIKQLDDIKDRETIAYLDRVLLGR